MIESYHSSAESSDEDENGAEQGSSKNKKKSLALAEKLLQKEKAAETEQPLWQRSLGEDKKPKEESLFERITEKKSGAEEAAREAGESEIPPLEEMNRHEEQEAVLPYTEARLADARQKAAESTEGGTAQAEELAAVILLEEFQQEIKENPEKPVREILDKAEAVTAERIDVRPDEENASEDGTETPQEQNQGEIVLEGSIEDDSETEDDGTVVIHASSGSATPPTGGGGSTGAAGAGGAGAGGSPPVPPIPGGGAGGLPPMPPLYPTYTGGYMPPSGGGAPPTRFNTAPASPNTLQTVYANERRAIAQGLLVGGIVGYLIGRRRGRIKTEKRLMPIQKKLERQVTDLHAAVAEKEQTVRKLAAEKVWALKTEEQRQRFTESLRPTVVQPASAERSTASQKSLPRAERLGRVLVESPAVILGSAAAIGVERSREARKPLMVNTKVEAYNTEELKQAAEKIRIDNTTLKELYDGGRLDEKAVRRVLTEFVEGRSVRAAVSRELLQKELRFERDPGMRDAPAVQSAGGVSGAEAALPAASAAALLIQGAETTSSTSDSKEQTPSPKKTEAKSQKQEIVETAIASVVIIAIFTVLIALAL